MTPQVRARDLGLACGSLPPGGRNSIADVPGVTIGHTTLIEGDLRTGVTAVLPHDDNLFRDKPVAAACVLNGFGKSTGLGQVNEFGTLETPILLTNTFAVGTCADALIRRAIAADPEIGRQTSTINPIVLECNDGYLNDIQAIAITEAHAVAAIDAAEPDFAVGAVGAGTGMSCFGFKGGIGSASRRVRLDGDGYHLGVLVLANFGRAGDLRLPDGRRIDPSAAPTPEAGSCIIVLATDVPLDHRQLGRVARRAGVGLAWCGAFWGNGSGDIALGFTTANRVPHDADQDLIEHRILAEARVDRLFQAAAEATQEAVLDALAAAQTMVGRAGHRRVGLRDVLGSGR
ncbi:MAG TPA: P1 family peptidase [Acetobacteraceae bacterium]|nr:P1 family peptidase [Acetobacteraceae bacterium]